MTITAKQLWPETQLTTSAAVFYLSSGNTILKQVVFTNTDTASRLITVYIVPNLGTANAANIIIDALSIAPGQSYIAVELSNLVLITGDSVQCKADSGAVVNSIASGFVQV